MKFPIKNRFTCETIFEAELDASYEKKPRSVQLGAAVRVAFSKKANLTDANLAGANLRRANLREADLSRADLSRADLRRADLRGADLRGADLRGADLRWADLSRADLRRADLRGADLRGADLRGADLRWADLRGANLTGQGILQINGLRWAVLITPEYLQISCEKHSHNDWRSFDDRRVAEMDGKDAVKFWRENKDWLLTRCEWASGFRKKEDAA